METTVKAQEGKWAAIRHELRNDVVANKAKPAKERKTMKAIFEDFANRHDTTLNSTQNYYYTNIKPDLEKPKDLDKNIEDSIKNTKVESVFRDPKKTHKIGSIVEATVTAIKDFGVFAKTDEGFEGLIHISQITASEYVVMPEDFFYVGEKIKAKVVRHDGDKLSFSTRQIGGKEKVNPAFTELARRSESKPKQVEAKKPMVVKEAPAKPKELKLLPKMKKTETSPVPKDDRDNIIEFIKRYSDNNVSPEALKDIEEMIAKNGVFQTTMSLMETVRDLDVSSFITQLTKEKLEGGHLRQFGN